MASRSLMNRFRMRELKRALPPSGSTPSSRVSVTNPFIPHLNKETGRWAPPRYSLRRQAELIKAARLEGTVHLLPPGPKLKLATILEAREAVGKAESIHNEDKPRVDVMTPIDWVGVVKLHEPAGSDVGNRLYAGKKQMFKGHKWERVKKQRRNYRRILMKDMKKRILRWRLYHVKRKPWPLSNPRIGKSRKLPF